eukprot:Skav200803  [mRNA]  locus=scaffold2549:183610:186243:- [translate_table: standard]
MLLGALSRRWSSWWRGQAEIVEDEGAEQGQGCGAPQERRRIYGCTKCKAAWWQKNPDPKNPDPEFTPCCVDRHIVEFTLQDGPLKLDNQHLPVIYSGGARNQIRSINVSSTTYYNTVGEPTPFPEDMGEELEKVLTQPNQSGQEETLQVTSH